MRLENTADKLEIVFCFFFLSAHRGSVSMRYTPSDETSHAITHPGGHLNGTRQGKSHDVNHSNKLDNAFMAGQRFGEIRNNIVSDRVTLLENILGKSIRQHDNCTKVLPQALIVGVLKSGTETLTTFLASHPDIAMQMKLPTMLFFNVHYARGLNWYRDQMPCSTEGQVTMEKSPQYFQAPRAPKRIHAMNSSIKLILIVREPIKRSISHYSHVVEKKPGRYMHSFEQTITNRRGNIDKTHTTIIRSLYSVQLKTWLKYFKMDQIHIVNGDNFKINPVEELIKVEDFLKIKRYFSSNMFAYNSDKGFYCLNVSGATDGCMWAGKGRPHPQISKPLIIKLKHFFKPYNEMFFNIIGQRFDWNNQIDG